LRIINLKVHFSAARSALNKSELPHHDNCILVTDWNAHVERHQRSSFSILADPSSHPLVPVALGSGYKPLGIASERSMNDDVKARLAGFGCVVAGAAISWPSIFDRLRIARQGVPSISTWSTASFLVAPLIIIGMTLMILGARTEAVTRDAERKRITPVGNIIALLCAVTGFGGMLGTSYLLRSYGYQ
jgi:hypothetical protein